MTLCLPLRIVPSPESLKILDSAGTAVCYLYVEDQEDRRQQTKRLSREEAVELAKVIARAVTEKVEGKSGV